MSLRVPAKPWFAVLAIGFVAAAVFHGVAALRGESVVWRHGLFVLINLACAAGMLRRPRGFAIFFAGLCLQQLYSHGGDAWRSFRAGGRVDWPSLVVLVVMPAALALLLVDRRAASHGPRAGQRMA